MKFSACLNKNSSSQIVEMGVTIAFLQRRTETFNFESIIQSLTEWKAKKYNQYIVWTNLLTDWTKQKYVLSLTIVPVVGRYE